MPPTYANGHISATGDPIHFMFGSRVGFSGTADRTAICCTKTDIDDLGAYMICIFISLSQFLFIHAISLRPVNVLLARDSICLARYMLSPIRPSVRLSVSQTGVS